MKTSNPAGSARAAARAALAGALATGGLLAVGLAPADAAFVTSFEAGVVHQDGTSATQANGHPFKATTRFTIETRRQGFFTVPTQMLRDADVALPPGFLGNPQALPRCSAGAFNAKECPPESQVGVANLGFAGNPPGATAIYNLVPPPGVPGQFGFQVGNVMVHLNAKVRSDGDYGLTMRSRNVSQSLGLTEVGVTFWGVPSDPAHDGDRGGPSTAPRKAFLTNPGNCAAGPMTTTLRASSWDAPDTWDQLSIDHDFNGEPMAVTGCEHVPFEPSMNVALDTTRPDAPTGMNLDLAFPQDGIFDPDAVATAQLKDAKVTLPEGMTINPSSASGLTACTDAQMGFGNDRAVRCPDASRIGNVWATTPLLEEGLGGGVYVGSQLSDDPESGQMFRIFLQIENEDRGVRIKLPGTIRVDQATGRLETTFRNNPQLPISALRVQFKSGPRAPLATPATCGTGQIVGELQSWSGQTRYVSSPVTFPCSSERGFAPSFSAGSLDATAGAFAPFTVRLGRQDGSQYFKDLRMDLPTGLLAKLDGIPLCSEADANAGSCDQASRVGTATIGAGVGDPFYLQGGVYLTGPYNGGPFGLAVITRAVAGPFDLGKVVVRQAIDVDPRDASISIRSDAFPQMVKGVPLRLRSIVVDMDRPGFMVNPTDCSAKEITATIGSADGTSTSHTQPFAAANCDRLELEPNLQLQLSDPSQTTDGEHPGFTARLTTAAGDANLARVAVALPLSMALDPDNAQALCTPEQAAAQQCPAGSIVGRATAKTPLLHEPLTGDVYFVEGRKLTATGQVRRTFPKLWVALRGAISLDVWADSDVDASQRLVNTFASIPDAPISSFQLDIFGGEHGILVLNTDICRGRQIATSSFSGHNGTQVQQINPLTTPCSTTASTTNAKKAKKAKKAGGKKSKRRAARRAT